ncbi:uncharacterized protein LOC135808603 [Sycon ciliatum]|uniref:uncharacterized protein LOC135808603 n=1 Tax=Sycon ciliatum TaxID=27933 RepID=UPI0020A9B51C|eukprot:scpid44226/ scgid13194/ Protein phosphatase 1 regulatory subunit 3D; Protein phosphatase 1 regulatory subunit 6; Protein phosphatase 1-binding subunit R6
MPMLMEGGGEISSAKPHFHLSHRARHDEEDEKTRLRPLRAIDLSLSHLTGPTAAAGGRRSLPENSSSSTTGGASNHEPRVPRLLHFTAIPSARNNIYSPPSPVGFSGSSCDSSPEFFSRSSHVERTSSSSYTYECRSAVTETATAGSIVTVSETSTSVSSGHTSRSPLRSILRSGSGGATKLQRSRSAPNDRRKTTVDSDSEVTVKIRQQTRSVVFGDERGLPLVSVFHYQCGHPLRRHRSAPENICNAGIGNSRINVSSNLSYDDLSDDEFAQARRSSKSNAESGPSDGASTLTSNGLIPMKYYLDCPQPWSSTDFSARLEANMVCLERLSVSEHGDVLGLVRVANVAYYKSVKIRLTVDNWENCVEVIGKYSRSLDEKLDLFTFTYKLPAVGITFGRGPIAISARSSFVVAQFAVRYTVDSKEFWDNNYNKNYRIVREWKH